MAPPISYVLLETTWDCNLNCKMCPRNLFGPVGKRLKMSLRRVNDILDQIPTINMANFAGLGEPFTHPNIYEIFDELAKRRINVLLTTNGTLLTEKNIKRLSNTNFTMHVSIDSPLEENFKKLRGYSLEKILNNLRTLRRLRPDIKLVIQSLYMKNTMNDFIYFIPILKELNASMVVIYPISFNREDEDVYEPFLVESFKETKTAFSRLCQLERIPLRDRTVYPKIKHCDEPWRGPMITPMGDVMPCCYVYEARGYPNMPKTWNEWYHNKKVEVPMSNYIMGNVFEQSMEEIWNSDKYNQLRDMVELCNRNPLPPKTFRELRENINLNRYPFSYCRICLWRHSQAC